MKKGYHRISLLNTFVDNLTMSETLEVINESIDQKTSLHHTVVNAAKIVAMQDNPELAKSVNEADLINADGAAVVWASKLLGNPLKERVAGIDIFTNLVANAHLRNESVYLLGATEEVVEKVVEKFTAQYGNTIIGGYRNGYFKQQDEQAIVSDIVASGATYLFVAMTSPKKEIFLYEHREKLSKLGFIMGVGGSFDVVSGKVKRAPLFMQKLGLEWFFRLIQEPRRLFKRYFVQNLKFILLLFKAYFTK